MVDEAIARARDAYEPMQEALVAATRSHVAFATCLAEQHAQAYVGSMTLWIDVRCNW